MRFPTHLLSSLAVGLAVYPRQPLRLAALVAAGTLVDLDHLLLYSLHTGDWSVVGALRYDRYRNRRIKLGDKCGVVRVDVQKSIIEAGLVFLDNGADSGDLCRHVGRV